LLKTVVEAGVPILVFFAMAVVGMELTTDDFRRVALQPGTVVAATVGQFVFLPVIGWLLACCLDLQPAIAQGVLPVAPCPTGRNVAPLLLPAVLVFRGLRFAEGNNLTGADHS
jgi:predicted Na+-dependent transporter